MNKNKVSNKIIKRIILLIREKIYFNDVRNIKNTTIRNTIVISSNDNIIPKDMSSYHEYYLKYKKSA